MRLNWGTAPVGPFEIFEICLVLLAVAISLIRPRFASAFFSRLESGVKSVAPRRWACALILFLFPIVLRLLLLPVYGVPRPVISDEYAYLLQSDTFASGRLTNPAPPMPEHFASVYILTRPTYTAEYQIGQALALAAGQVATGWPWAGVLLSMGILCAVVYWALLAWIPSVWAFAGTLVVIDISLGVLSYWTNSYWGGNVPAIGGALALGGLARIPGKSPLLYSVLAAAGLTILLNSRPLEGVFLIVVAATALAFWTLRAKRLRPVLLFTRVMPALAVSALVALAFAGFYNSRVTTKPGEFPYLLYRSRYGLPQGFFWQKPLVVNTAAMPSDIRSEYEDQLRQHARRRSVKGLAGATGGKLRRFWEFYIGIPLTLALLFLPLIWRGSNMQLALWALVAVLGLDNLLFFAYFPHYSAAVTVLIALVLIECIRRMRVSSEAGLFLSRALPAVCLISLLVPVVGRLLEPLLPASLGGVKRLWQSEFIHDIEREVFAPRLEQEPGRQLVLVRYGPYKGQKTYEWIYNRADIANAKIIWARYGEDSTSNRQLVSLFPGRKLWLAEPDNIPPRVTPFQLPNDNDRGSSK